MMILKITAPTIITIGNFDGMHLGHQSLLKALVKQAKSNQWHSCVICFDPMPKEYFLGKSIQRVMQQDVKYALFKDIGIDIVCCLPFDKSIAQMSPNHFVQSVLCQYFRARGLIVGDDFKFGYQREGDVSLLKQLASQHDFDVRVFENEMLGDIRISSTAVRKALLESHFGLVAQMLGHCYTLSGTVIRGSQRGRQLGWPTANIALGDFNPPIHGVFAVKVNVHDGLEAKAVANIGTRPTVDGGQMFVRGSPP